MDLDGRFPDFIWDIASLGIGVKSLVGNIQSGNTRAAIGDGVGIVIDGIAAALPFVPGGVGVVRAGTKIADTVDNTTDAVKNFDDSFDIYKDIKLNIAKDDANISIEILPENKIDRSLLKKPDKRGNSFIFRSDGTPVDILFGTKCRWTICGDA